MRRFANASLILHGYLFASFNAACSTHSAPAGMDATTDRIEPTFDSGADAASADVATPSLPPSPDCRFIDDRITCVDTYILPGTFLYACGHLTSADSFDGGIDRPYPPPLPATYDCRNVAPPALEAGPSPIGALWCCNGTPAACARAIALDVACSTGQVAYSCLAAGSYPPNSDDGGLCSTVDPTRDAGIEPTPPQSSGEAIRCCSASR